MEIEITFLEDETLTEFSDSVANSGLENIGRITWQNACEHASKAPLVKPENQDELRNWIAEFGAWDREEIAAMSDTETNALLLQFVAGDLREYLDHEDTEDFDRWNENCGGYIFRTDDGKLFYSIG